MPGGRKINTLGTEQFNTFLVSLLIKDLNWTIDHHSCERNINSRLDIRESFVDVLGIKEMFFQGKSHVVFFYEIIN